MWVKKWTKTFSDSGRQFYLAHECSGNENSGHIPGPSCGRRPCKRRASAE